MNTIVCTLVKNEQRFVREWVEHYLSIGFNKLYIFEDFDSNTHKEQLQDFIDNDSVILTPLSSGSVPIDKVSRRYGTNLQYRLFDWFFKECKSGNIEADWVGFFDVDEFIEFRNKYTLESLENEFCDYGGVLISWVMYGANGHIKRPKGNVVDNYTSHLPFGVVPERDVMWCAKSLVNVNKSEGIDNIHYFKGCVRTNYKNVKTPLCFDKVLLRHYYTKSWEDYLDRTFSRGNLGNNSRCLDWFFECSPEFESRRKQMIEEQRYRHCSATMWISHKDRIISGGNEKKLMKLNQHQPFIPINVINDKPGHYDYLIVGAGLYGLTCARILTNKGFSCLIIDKNPYLGGLCHTTKHNGIDIHENGIHIFHTSDDQVWNFVNKYIKLSDYQLKVCATDGKEIYSLPFNMYTFSKILGLNTPEEVYEYLSKTNFDNPNNLEEQAINLVGKEVYEKLIKGYTEKQWGKKCTELPSSIIERLPVRYSYDNNYFNDKYQGVCDYSELANHIVNGINAEGNHFEGKIDFILNEDFLANKEKWLSISDKIIYCGAVDELLEYELGELPWRSLIWEHKKYEYNGHNGQGCALLNNTDSNTPYTRSIDHVQISNKDFRGETILTYEYPTSWEKGKERCYPNGSNDLYTQYTKLLSIKYPKIILGGRIGLYKYMDMDDTICHAINFCSSIEKQLNDWENYNNSKFCKIWIVGTNRKDIKINNNPYYNIFITNDEPNRQNINSLNRFLSEFVAMWYVWKNNLYSNYIGFCHYHRLINISDIKFEQIDKSIQYFYEAKYSQNDIDKHLDLNLEYPFLSMKSLTIPDFILEDIKEYCNLQENKDIIKECSKPTKNNEYSFYHKEIFCTDWETFCDMMVFINGFIEYTSDKYKLKNRNDWKNHIENNVIGFYRDLSKSYAWLFPDHSSELLWQNQDDFLKIFNEGKGINEFCNNWRVYSYVIEFLISVFISTKKHFHGTLYG